MLNIYRNEENDNKMAKIINGQMIRPLNKLMNKHMNKSMNRSMNGSMNKPMNKHMSKPGKKEIRNGMKQIWMRAGMYAVTGVISLVGAYLWNGNGICAKAEAAEGSELIYCIGSVSKVYATAAVMKLSEEGRVDLDAPVTEYIPEFKMQDVRYKDITVRMLMDHTSGIMGTTWRGGFLYQDVRAEHHDMLLKELSTQRLKADPGKYAAYCNDGFDLLEILVEKVTGLSYTEYVTKELAEKCGAEDTQTAYNVQDNEMVVKAYDAENHLYDTGKIMCVGAGGIYATASDVAKFGASFFEENENVLSQKAKDQMATCWKTGEPDPFMDGCGLGWDEVSFPEYEEKGIQVLGKGGDVITNHAFLMVAPEEKVSVSVLSNGGSSGQNALLAQAIMDVILEDRGIQIEREEVATYEMLPKIPAEYDKFEGYYTSQDETGAVINKISFPEHRYMHVEYIGPTRTTSEDYVLTKQGVFASLAYDVGELGSLATDQTTLDELRIASNPSLLDFQLIDGKVYITCERNEIIPGLGTHKRQTYAGENLTENPVSEEVMNVWQGVCEKDILLNSEVYSSQSYDNAIMHFYLAKEVPGYVYACTGMGTRLLKIIDETQAVAFQTMPSSVNRDLIDVTLKQDGDATKIIMSNGLEWITSDNISKLDCNRKEIIFDKDTVIWFGIDDSLANDTISVNRPENSAIYVFNKYGEIMYTSHNQGMNDHVPMPRNGKIVFSGEKGNSITID